MLRKTKSEVSPVIFPNINYDRLIKGFVKVDSGVSELTIKNYFSFFAKLEAGLTEESFNEILKEFNDLITILKSN